MRIDRAFGVMPDVLQTISGMPDSRQSREAGMGPTCDLRARRVLLHSAALFLLPRLLAVFDNDAIAC